MVWQVGSKVRVTCTTGDKTSLVPRPDLPEREGAGIHCLRILGGSGLGMRLR